MKQFQNFEDGIKINIFKYVDHPLNLILTCQTWSAISKNPYAKTEWLIVHYGKAHALFHAVRLGPTFIDMAVCQTLITKNVVISRYLIQRLFKNFGTYNQKSIEFKIEHNFGQCDAAKIYDFRKEIKTPWANHLFIMFVLIYLLNEEYSQLANANEGPLKGSNMELSRFLSAHKMLKDIKILISNKIIAPRQKSLRLDPHIHQVKQTRFLRSLTAPTFHNNNVGTSRTRPSRNVSRSRRNQLARQLNTKSRRHVSINNEDTLNRIASLPQQTANDPLINQFFNGSPFI